MTDKKRQMQDAREVFGSKFFHLCTKICVPHSSCSFCMSFRSTKWNIARADRPAVPATRSAKRGGQVCYEKVLQALEMISSLRKCFNVCHPFSVLAPIGGVVVVRSPMRNLQSKRL